MMINKQTSKIGIYIHIPFCIKKCSYCDFLSGPADEDAREQYIQALIEELRAGSKEFAKRKVCSIFFGGGTPSVIKRLQTKRIMQAVSDYYEVDEEAEITTEANPGTLDEEKLCAYVEMGFNRISIGLQSIHSHELKALGRIHSCDDFLRGYEQARRAGFRNINVDLMSGIPDQSLQSWLETLKLVSSLRPEHISAYSLILEEGTSLYEEYGAGRLDGRLPDEDTEREMYHRTAQVLKKEGFIRYEISNYALPGYECRHNLLYWERGDYAGFGLGAASLIDNVRYKNTENMDAYLKAAATPSRIRIEKEQLVLKDRMEEFMFLGLRKTEGVSEQDFNDNFGVSFESVYGNVVKRYAAQGLLARKKGRIYLTERGIDVSNIVMAEFLL